MPYDIIHFNEIFSEQRRIQCDDDGDKGRGKLHWGRRKIKTFRENYIIRFENIIIFIQILAPVVCRLNNICYSLPLNVFSRAP